MKSYLNFLAGILAGVFLTFLGLFIYDISNPNYDDCMLDWGTMENHGCEDRWDAPKETKDEPVEKDSKHLLSVKHCSKKHKDKSTTEFQECVESEKARMVKQSKGKSRVEICNKFYNNMLPSEKKVFAVGRCLTDENYDPAIHKKELVAQEKYEGNFELYEKAMKKMEMDKVKELQRLREANAKRRQSQNQNQNNDSEAAILKQQIEQLKAMQNRQYYQTNSGTNNYAQCLIDKGSFVGCDMNYQRPVEVDVNVSGEIDLNLDIN